MNDVKNYVFENTDVNIVMFDSILMFEVYSTGMALGQSKWNGKRTSCTPHRARIDKNLENAEIKPLVHNGLKYISESQLYDLMLEMKTDKVKPFRKWVTSEVLPQIRQTGGYVQSDKEDEFIDKYFPSFSDETKRAMVHDLSKTNALYKEQIQKLEPQAKAFQDLMTAKGYLQMIDVAGIVDKGRNSLFQFLRSQKVLTKQSQFNVPYGRFRNNGMFTVTTYRDEETGRISSVTMVSPKGLAYIYKLIKKNDLLDKFNSELLLEMNPVNSEVSA